MNYGSKNKRNGGLIGISCNTNNILKNLMKKKWPLWRVKIMGGFTKV